MSRPVKRRTNPFCAPAMNTLGLFLNKEIRTGGHTRSLDLMARLAARGHLVTIFMNTFLAFSPSRFRSPLLSVP